MTARELPLHKRDAADTASVDRPRLTLPDAEAEWLRAHYDAAEVILEYGSGGSTVLAAEMPGKTVFSVESDLDWAASMARYFVQTPPAATVQVYPVDIGPVRKWGAPAGESGWQRYPNYSLSIWDDPAFVAPDLVLIDGRFRAACLLAVMIRTEKPVTVLFDDHVKRKPYHVVEQWISPSETRGRMARFEVRPWTLPPRELAKILPVFFRQN